MRGLRSLIVAMAAVCLLGQPVLADSAGGRDPLLGSIMAEVLSYQGKTFAVTRADTIIDKGKAEARRLRYDPQAGSWQLLAGRKSSLDDGSIKEPPLGYSLLADFLAAGAVPAGQRDGLLVYRLRAIPDQALGSILLGAGRFVSGEILVDPCAGKPFVRELRVSADAPFTTRTSYHVDSRVSRLEFVRRYSRKDDGVIYPVQSSFQVDAKAMFVNVSRNQTFTFSDFGPLTPLGRRG
jgi:hypothetical protein